MTLIKLPEHLNAPPPKKKLLVASNMNQLVLVVFREISEMRFVTRGAGAGWWSVEKFASAECLTGGERACEKCLRVASVVLCGIKIVGGEEGSGLTQDCLKPKLTGKKL